MCALFYLHFSRHSLSATLSMSLNPALPPVSGSRFVVEIFLGAFSIGTPGVTILFVDPAPAIVHCEKRCFENGYRDKGISSEYKSGFWKKGGTKIFGDDRIEYLFIYLFIYLRV